MITHDQIAHRSSSLIQSGSYMGKLVGMGQTWEWGRTSGFPFAYFTELGYKVGPRALWICARSQREPGFSQHRIYNIAHLCIAMFSHLEESVNLLICLTRNQNASQFSQTCSTSPPCLLVKARPLSLYPYFVQTLSLLCQDLILTLSRLNPYFVQT